MNYIEKGLDYSKSKAKLLVGKMKKFYGIKGFGAINSADITAHHFYLCRLTVLSKRGPRTI